MKRFELLLALVVVALGGFVGMETLAARRPAQVVATDSHEGTLARRLIRASRTPSSAKAERDETFAGKLAPAEMRRRIAQGQKGTYISELLTARDSALARWPDRTVKPLRIWVQRAQLDGWTDEYMLAVQSAFDTWSDVGIPMHFTYVNDSASADVHVRFRDRFDTGISGKTVWSRDARFWLLSGDIELAVAHPQGGFVDVAQMRAIALHEVGHLLGLDHTASSDHIMAPKVRMRDLSEQDRATIRLVYSVPAGTLKSERTSAER